ncbi:MAG: adenine phosphoribosyltransferase [SAR202 cluster bacterium]|nr:adenine phosphoribosyltransferase [SAR202 cluster bacterium]
MELKSYIRDIPDFPKFGIIFKDITPLLQSPAAFRYVVDEFAGHYESRRIDAILAIEARGFLLGSALAYKMGKPLVPVRKRGKLPFQTVSVTYALEYGSDTVEIHRDGIMEGHRVLIVDDVLATGGTMAAACKLVQESGGKVEGLAVLMELAFLEGRKNLPGYDIFTLIQY